MKVLHLIDSGGLYGAEQMLLALAEEQIKQGLQPTILSCGLPGEADKPLEIEAEKRNIPIIKWRMKAGLNFKGTWQILKHAKKEQVDILHSHGYKFNILMGLIPSCFLNSTLVTTVHGYVHAKKYSSGWIYQIIDKLCLRRMDKVFFVSQNTRNDFLTLDDAVVIQNGIDVTPLNTEVPDRRFINNVVRIIAVGRLAKEKGFDYLLKSIKKIHNKAIQIELTIMGTGECEAELYELTHNLGISKQVIFKGFVTNPSRYFNDFDLLIMPSLTEGLPITLLEAMREQLPILASNVGEIPFVLHDSYKLINVPNDLPNLSENIDSFIESYSKDWQLVSKNLYDKFLTHYSSTVMAEKYHFEYKKLVKN